MLLRVLRKVGFETWTWKHRAYGMGFSWNVYYDDLRNVQAPCIIKSLMTSGARGFWILFEYPMILSNVFSSEICRLSEKTFGPARLLSPICADSCSQYELKPTRTVDTPLPLLSRRIPPAVSLSEPYSHSFLSSRRLLRLCFCSLLSHSDEAPEQVK